MNIRAIRLEQTAITINDGSLKDEREDSATVIEGASSEGRLKGKVQLGNGELQRAIYPQKHGL